MPVTEVLLLNTIISSPPGTAETSPEWRDQGVSGVPSRTLHQRQSPVRLHQHGGHGRDRVPEPQQPEEVHRV